MKCAIESWRFQTALAFTFWHQLCAEKKALTANYCQSLAAEGFIRVKVNGEILELSENIELDKNLTHNIEIVADRLIKKPGLEERLVDSLATCLRRWRKCNR